MTECCCGGRIPVKTPQMVKDELEIDVFEEIFDLADGTSDYEEAYKKALWKTFRNRMLGNYSLEFWEQCVADKLDMVMPIYDALMAKWADFDPTDTAVSSYDLQIDSTPMSGTDGDVTSYKREDMPVTPVGTDEYLTDRNQTVYTPNHSDHHVYRAEDGLNATTFAQMMDDIESPLMRFVGEFDGFFTSRWSL